MLFRAKGELPWRSLADWHDLQWVTAVAKSSYTLMLLLLEAFSFVSSAGKQRV